MGRPPYQRPADRPEEHVVTPLDENLLQQLRTRLDRNRPADRPSEPFVRPDRPVTDSAEEHSSSDEEELTFRATPRDGDDDYRKNGHKRARLSGKYEVTLGYDRRLFLRDKWARGVKLTPETAIWAKNMQPQDRVFGDTENEKQSRVSVLSKQDLESWPMVGRRQTLEDVYDLRKTGKNGDGCTFPVESFDEEYCSTSEMLQDDLNTAHLEDSIAIEAEYGIEIPTYIDEPPKLIRECLAELSHTMAKPVEGGAENEVYFPSQHQLMGSLLRMMKQRCSDEKPGRIVREYAPESEVRQRSMPVEIETQEMFHGLTDSEDEQPMGAPVDGSLEHAV